MFFPAKLPFSRFIVSDRSMEPKFSEGDHVLTFNWAKPGKGDVVVFKYKEVFFVKRIKSVSNMIYVEGDNKKLSSRIDPLDRSMIIGKVIARY